MWTKLNRPKPADAVRAWACTKDAQAFCREQGLQNAKVYTVETYGHEKWSAALAWHCARKMQYFHTMADGNHRHGFSRAEIEGSPAFPESLDEDFPKKHNVLEALKVLAALVPNRQKP